MDINQALSLFDNDIHDRQYRRIELFINGSDSSWKDDIQFSILSKESTNRAFTYMIYNFLKDKLDRPYSLNNAIRENLAADNEDIYIDTINDLRIKLKKIVGEII